MTSTIRVTPLLIAVPAMGVVIIPGRARQAQELVKIRVKTLPPKPATHARLTPIVLALEVAPAPLTAKPATMGQEPVV